MPSIVTHYLFSEDAYKQAEKEVQENILKSHQIYNLFAQSFDNLFYYNLLSLQKGKNIRKLGNMAQRIKINDYFKNIIETIKEKKLEHNSEVLAYLYGSLTHYVLDSTCHPFVIYQAGWIDEHKNSLKYRGNHEKIEVNIDAIYYYEKEKKPLYQASLANTLLPKVTFTKELKDTISTVFERTFHQKNMSNIYEKSMKQGHNIIKYFVTDHLGMKKVGYKIFDFIFFKNPTKYQNLSFYIKKPNYEFLNRKRETWYNPTDRNLKSSDSFDDLYNHALKKIVDLFSLTNQVMNSKISLDYYLEKLGNKSYTSGLNWNNKAKFTYFKMNNSE